MKHLLFGFLLFATWSAQAQIADSAKREIKLEGAINFRDLGGYVTKDGKHIIWGKIYRAATLQNLTSNDTARLKQLQIDNVYDFRGPAEVAAGPDRLPSTITRTSLIAGSENIGDAKKQMSTLGSQNADSLLYQVYGNISVFQKRYKPVFDQLLKENKNNSILFHCTAGKDRTGIAAALILYALGVDKKTIFEDYEATNYYRRNENDKMIKMLVSMYHMDETNAKNLMLAKSSYLQITFDAINKQFGNMETFLDKELGLDKSKLAILKTKYTF